MSLMARLRQDLYCVDFKIGLQGTINNGRSTVAQHYTYDILNMTVTGLKYCTASMRKGAPK